MVQLSQPYLTAGKTIALTRWTIVGKVFHYTYIYRYMYIYMYIYVCCSVTQPCPTLCNPVNYSIPGFPVLHHLPAFACTHDLLCRLLMDPEVASTSQYCKECCYEHWGVCVFSNYCFHFLQVHTQEWNFRVIWQLHFSFLRSLHAVFHNGCTSLHSPRGNAKFCLSDGKDEKAWARSP